MLHYTNLIIHLFLADTLDYVSGELTIDFKLGDAIGSTRCTHIAIIDDDLLESNETFYAVLTSSNDAIATASPTVTSVTILDDRRKGISAMYYIVKLHLDAINVY